MADMSPVSKREERIDTIAEAIEGMFSEAFSAEGAHTDVSKQKRLEQKEIDKASKQSRSAKVGGGVTELMNVKARMAMMSAMRESSAGKVQLTAQDAIDADLADDDFEMD